MTIRNKPLYERMIIGLPDCPECYGTGLTEIETPRGYSSAAPCQCSLAAAIPARIRRAKLPLAYRDAKLSGMEKITDNEHRAQAAAVKFIKTWRDGETGLFITGPEGTGKSRMVSAIAIGLISTRGVQPFYWTSADLITAAKAEFDAQPGEAIDVVARAKECTLLILDDLGAEQSTPWSIALIGEIIDARYREALTTIIASNLSVEAIANRYDNRVAGRIRERCVILTLDGASRRLEVTA